MLPSNSIKEKETVPALNLLRGVAALSVCIFHLFTKDFLNGLPFIKGIVSRGHLGLDIFFVVSGFIIPFSLYQNKYKIANFPRFLLKRLIRIEPPYIASFLLVVLIYCLNGAIYGQPYTINWNQVAAHFLYLNGYLGFEPFSGVYWTLAIELQFYLLIGLFFPVIVHTNHIYKLALLAGVIILHYCVLLPKNLYILQFCFHFITGVLVFLYMTKKLKANAFLFLIALMLILLSIQDWEVGIVVGFVVPTIIFLKRTWKVTDFLGKISFSLYLVHLEIAWTVMRYIKRSITDWGTLTFLGLAASIGFATLFYFLIEKPSIKLSKKIKY